MKTILYSSNKRVKLDSSLGLVDFIRINTESKWVRLCLNGSTITTLPPWLFTSSFMFKSIKPDPFWNYSDFYKKISELFNKTIQLNGLPVDLTIQDIYVECDTEFELHIISKKYSLPLQSGVMATCMYDFSILSCYHRDQIFERSLKFIDVGIVRPRKRINICYIDYIDIIINEYLDNNYIIEQIDIDFRIKNKVYKVKEDELVVCTNILRMDGLTGGEMFVLPEPEKTH